MNRIEKIYSESKTAADYVKSYFLYLSEIFQKLDYDVIAEVVALLLSARKKGKNVFFVGNGGSAATASHFANDVGIGTRPKQSPFKAISLTDNNAVMTAIANDFGYENLFVKQLETVYCAGDILVAISASGNSPNVLKAVEYVKEKGGITVGLSGFDGGKLKQSVDYAMHVPTENNEFGPVEDVHMIFDHIIGTYLMFTCKAEKA